MSSDRSQSQIPDFGIPGWKSVHSQGRAQAVLNSSHTMPPLPTLGHQFREFAEVQDDIDAEPLDEWNKGVFSETLNQFGPPSKSSTGTPLYRKLKLDKSIQLGARPRLGHDDSPPVLAKGTFNGTKVAATEVYKLVIQRHGAYFDTANFESSAPVPLNIKEKQELYTWKFPSGPEDYPPHLSVIPQKDQSPLVPGVPLLKYLFWWTAGWVIPKNVMDIINRVLPDSDIPPLDGIFNAMRLIDTAVLLKQVFPEEIIDWADYNPDHGDTLASITDLNAQLVNDRKGIYTVKNIGSERQGDWFEDAQFAQQHLTGPNPCTLELANDDWISKFRREAEIQRKEKIVEVIDNAKSTRELYVQDYSYFRRAIKIPEWQTMCSKPEASSPGWKAHTDSQDMPRYAVASVCLFHLDTKTGRLHPLAIVIDYKGNMKDSTVIFNKRVYESDKTVDQATDWPWRYAKTCVQVSDWIRHEVTVHLVHTHFIEEAVIVAAQRSFPTDHAVFKLLSPHWIKTLSLNAAARTTLVPDVVINLSGMTGPQLMLFIQDAYSTFDWQENYIPNDLERRGFPIQEINEDKFHNCAYARNMHVLWQILRTFVAAYLNATGFTNDKDVAEDPWIKIWCGEMTFPKNPETGKHVENIKNFPNIKTLDQLIDAVTMCIHIASPQHTAVNYLQEYYQTFVINKPPSLYTPPVTTLAELYAMDEKKLMQALPIKKPREWLLASHLPHLLNMTVAKEQNLVNYAKSVYCSVKSTDGQQPDKKSKAIMAAAANFYKGLVGFTAIVEQFSKEMDKELPEYVVLKPDVTAVSILI